MKVKTLSRAWRDTPEGISRYRCALDVAQIKANATGFDHYVEANDLFQNYTVGLLPSKKNRRGFELQVQVVSCTDIQKCWPGHGPKSEESNP